MKDFIAWVMRLLRIVAQAERPARYPRLRITRSMLHALHRATMPTATNGEPLAFLRVRYASETAMDVIVAVDVLAFPLEAYVDGFAGANFDTDWAIQCANVSGRSNAGLFLAHRHGGIGKPNFSSVDRKTNLTVMVPLSYGMPTMPYGAMVLSNTDATIVLSVNGRLEEVRLEIVADALGRFEVTA